MTVLRRRVLIAFAACIVFVVLAAGLILRERAEVTAAVVQRGAALQRLVSQRVDQHDAHLTSLSALVQTADPAPLEALQQVAQTIIRFYPRIVAIDLLDPTMPARPGLMGTPAPGGVVASVSTLQTTPFLLVPDPSAERMHLLKRVPAEGPLRGALMLSVDLRRLIASDEPPGVPARITLALDDKVLLGEGPDAARRIVFDQPLSSRTQPLRLSLGAEPSPPLPWSLLLAAIPVLLVLAWALDRLLDARRVAREAGLRTLVARHDAKLAHASRVNAMGELASGIAHELTQPLTAILSHAQAGQRLAARPELDRAAITTAFDAAARNAKRAGEILGRLRSWLTKGQPTIEAVDLAAVVADVAQLVAIDAAAAGIALTVEPESGAMQVKADRVHLEQVVFNLVRNAMEALAGREGLREIRVGAQGPRPRFSQSGYATAGRASPAVIWHGCSSRSSRPDPTGWGLAWPSAPRWSSAMAGR
jgi:signal transduction histidine kinase